MVKQPILMMFIMKKQSATVTNALMELGTNAKDNIDQNQIITFMSQLKILAHATSAFICWNWKDFQTLNHELDPDLSTRFAYLFENEQFI